MPAFPDGALLCLSAHLAARSRHGCRVIDLNMHRDPPAALRQAILDTPLPRLLLIRVSFSSLPESIALTLFARETFPDLRIGWFGPFPTVFPGQARELSGVDFVISGDPEPVMRGMLDFYGLPQRVTKVPGLWIENPPVHPGPAWMDNLKGRDLTYWTSCWHDDPATLLEPDSQESRLRLTRGHTGLPCDRAHPGLGQPVRRMDFREMAVLFDKLASLGVTSIAMDDPPGAWDLETLGEWCAMLDACRNSRKWSLTLIPSVLPDELVSRLRNSWCGRVDFLFPSCDPENLRKYGCLLRPEQLRGTLRRLRAQGVDARAVFWIGGPEESAGEAARVYHALVKMGLPDHRLEPFPYHPDSQLAAEQHGGPAAPDIDDWFRRAMALEEDLPALAWGGAAGAGAVRATAAEIRRRLEKNPVRWARGALQAIREFDWQEAIERRLPAWLKPEFRS
ncbi:MAG: hypothetical protein U1F87_16080 [Kiritimatiellia bacterium]